MTEAVGAAEAELSVQPELDPSRYKAYAKTPSDMDQETINMVVDLIDGKLDTKPKPEWVVNEPAPATIDRVMNSDTIIYITDDDIPVGVVTLVDPTVKTYQGFVPTELYEMYSGVNLDGRIQQEFFAVADEYHDKGIGRELRAQIGNLGVRTFTVIDESDRDALEGMVRNGYEFVCAMPDDSSPSNSTLWID